MYIFSVPATWLKTYSQGGGCEFKIIFFGMFKRGRGKVKGKGGEGVMRKEKGGGRTSRHVTSVVVGHIIRCAKTRNP